MWPVLGDAGREWETKVKFGVAYSVHTNRRDPVKQVD